MSCWFHPPLLGRPYSDPEANDPPRAEDCSISLLDSVGQSSPIICSEDSTRIVARPEQMGCPQTNQSREPLREKGARRLQGDPNDV
jgi:hypothetical protein